MSSDFGPTQSFDWGIVVQCCEKHFMKSVWELFDGKLKNINVSYSSIVNLDKKEFHVILSFQVPVDFQFVFSSVKKNTLSISDFEIFPLLRAQDTFYFMKKGIVRFSKTLHQQIDKTLEEYS
jgi:hypothetical protein